MGFYIFGSKDILCAPFHASVSMQPTVPIAIRETDPIIPKIDSEGREAINNPNPMQTANFSAVRT
jgi:hypothetical protein